VPVKFGLQSRHPCSQQTKIPRPVALPKTRLFENQESPAFNPILETSSDPTNVIRGCKMVEIFACTTLFEKTVPPAFAIDKAALVRLSRCGDSCRHEIDDNNRSKITFVLSDPYHVKPLPGKHQIAITCISPSTANEFDFGLLGTRFRALVCLPSSLAFQQMDHGCV